MNETERLEERLRAFAAAPLEGADWEDVLRRAGERLTAHRQRLAILLAAALVLAALVVGLLVPFGSRPAPRGATGPPGASGPPGDSGAFAGALGPKGLHGPTGRIGVTGYVGPTGYTGPKAGPGWKFEPVPLTLSEVKEQSRLMGESIYWAGPRPEEIPYFMRFRGHFVVAYVRPADGDTDPSHVLVVATYPLREAFADLKNQAAGNAIAGPDESIIYVNPHDPKSVLMAFPGSDYQIEIRHPNPAVALATAKSGDIRPVGPGSHVAGGDHWLPGGGPITIAELRAVAPYIPLPDSALANDGNAGKVEIDASGDLESQEVGASVEYPASGIQLNWTGGLGRADFSDAQIIGGFPAIFIRSNRGARYKVLVLQVLPTMSVWLSGPVSKSDLIRVAKTLSAGPESPDAVLPPAYLSPPPSAPQGGLQLHAFYTGVLLHAMSADSVDAAARSLAFQPVAPPALGHPSAVISTDPTSAPPSDRVLSLRYSDPSMGRFWVLERPSLSTTTSQLREAVSQCSHVKHHRTCVGSASMVDLGGGVQALAVFLHDEGKQIVWVERGVYFKVIGSVNAVSGADADAAALSVARTVAAAAAG